MVGVPSDIQIRCIPSKEHSWLVILYTEMEFMLTSFYQHLPKWNLIDMLMAVVIGLHEHIFKQCVIFMFADDESRLIFQNQTKIK